MDIDLILFDWGGTLARYDRQPVAVRAGAEEAARVVLGRPDTTAADRLVEAVLTAEARASVDPEHREVDMWRVVSDWASGLAPSTPVDRIHEAGHALGQAWVGCLDLIPDTLAALQKLRDRGYRLGMVSNCSVPLAYCRQELERQGLATLLDPAVFSSEVGFRKPSAAIYEEAIRRACPAGRPDDLSRILFVGDSPRLDVIAPAAMGMKTVLVAREPGVWPEEDYARARPDLHLAAVAGLPELLNHSN